MDGCAIGRRHGQVSSPDRAAGGADAHRHPSVPAARTAKRYSLNSRSQVLFLRVSDALAKSEVAHVALVSRPDAQGRALLRTVRAALACGRGGRGGAPPPSPSPCRPPPPLPHPLAPP